MNEPETKPKVLYTLPVTSMISLPAYDPHAQTWEKKVNGYSLFLSNTDGIPFGRFGRLVMVAYATAVLKHGYKTPYELQSLTETARCLNITNTNGNGLASLHNNMTRWSSCMMQFGQVAADGASKKIWSFRVSTEADLKFLPKIKGKQPDLLNSFIHFSKEFYTLIDDHPMPVDIEAMARLDSVSQDMLLWTSRKARTLKKTIRLEVSKLIPQFYNIPSGRYASTFIKSFWTSFDAMHKEYPALKASYDDGGKMLVFSPSPTLVKEAVAKHWIRLGRNVDEDE